MTTAQERVLTKRSELESELDRLIEVARKGEDVAATRSLVLSSVDLLVQLSHVERDDQASAVVKQYQEMARKRREGGHA